MRLFNYVAGGKNITKKKAKLTLTNFIMELILRAKYSYDIIFARTFWLITPDREFSMKNQELSFCIIFRRTRDKIFQKKKKFKIPYFWALFSQTWAKMKFPHKSGSVTL